MGRERMGKERKRKEREQLGRKGSGSAYSCIQTQLYPFHIIFSTADVKFFYDIFPGCEWENIITVFVHTSPHTIFTSLHHLHSPKHSVKPTNSLERRKNTITLATMFIRTVMHGPKKSMMERENYCHSMYKREPVQKLDRRCVIST